MESSLRRTILPVKDWERFLEESKKEFYYLFDLKSNKEYKIEDFELIRTVGVGAFGRVYFAKRPPSTNNYAIKLLEKAKIVYKKQVKHTINEKKVLQAINFPFCIHLEHAFQDNSYLYLCLPFVNGGEMFIHLRTMKKFNEPLAKFYAAQVLLAFEYLHYSDAIFRDLKPENILLTQTGYIKITDFGFCKIVPTKTYSLCGTPEFLAPEVILHKGYGKSADWWAYGIFLYEMVAGYTPFRDNNPIRLYEKIVNGKYLVPRIFSIPLAHLIEKLLQVDVTRRFGLLKDGINDIKDHPWFSDVDWLALLNGYVTAPYVPDLKGEDDLSHFDEYEEIILTEAKIDRYKKLFKDF